MKLEQISNIGFIGECMVELKEDVGPAPGENIRRHFSGDTLNTAVYFLRENSGTAVQADFITAIGSDNYSKAMEDFWKQENIGCDYVLHLEYKNPGLYLIQVNESGERQFTYWRSDSAARYMFSVAGSDKLLNRVIASEAVYLSGITLAILTELGREALLTSLHLMKKRGGIIIFDDNFRPALWPDMNVARDCYTQLFSLCDIALLTLDDENQLFATADSAAVLAQLEQYDIPEVIIRNGAEDCIIQCQGRRYQVPAEQVSTVVDTTAAGDSFSAAYLTARIQGQGPEAAARAGHQLAAQVIQREGVFA